MSKNTKRGHLVLVLIVAVFNIIAFAVPFAKTPVFWLGYTFGMIAILFQAYIFKISFSGDGDAKSRFYGFPIARVGVYYMAAQLILSIAEITLASIIPLWVAVIVNALLLALAVIGCVTTDAMRDEIIRQDGQLKKDVSRMRELQSLADSMLAQCNDEDMKQTVKKIADELRFSDPVSSEATQELEDEMRSQMQDIQQAIAEGDAEGAKALCGKLKGNLAERNRVCSISK